MKNAGKENETVETKYFESDAAWFKRIRHELGSGKGRSPHWLIFNDEAHHAYRRGDVATEEQSLDEDKDLAKKNDREATIWIEGLTASTSWPAAAGGAASICASICRQRRSTSRARAMKLASRSRGSSPTSAFSMRLNPAL